MEQPYYEPPKPSALMRFFWRAAGADSYILQRCTYADHVKYFCLGGIVVATGALAGLAGGYAFYTIFEPKGGALDNEVHTQTMLMSIVFGIIWGLIIFNLDRFIVASTGKGDGTDAITRQELVGALPRILMGMVIALTISKPMEIRMFKSEIDAELHTKQDQLEQQYLENIELAYHDRFEASEKLIEKLEGEISVKEDRFRKIQNEYIEEGRIGHFGPKANRIKAEMDKAESDWSRILEKHTPVIEEEQDQIRIWKDEKRQARSEAKQHAAGLDGLLERIKIAHEVAGATISLVITLLFMAIELTPIFFKLMLIKSPYDFLSDNVKDLLKADHGIEVVYDFYTDKEGAQRDKVIHHESRLKLAEKIKLLEARSELNAYVLEKWKKAEKDKADQDPDAYFGPDREVF